MTTALILLRASEIGIPIKDLDLLSVGMLFDIFSEKSLDFEMSDNGEREATPSEVDEFIRNF